MHKLSTAAGTARLAVRDATRDVVGLPRWARILAALFLASAAVLAWPRGGPAGSVASLLLAVTVVLLGWRIADPEDRRWVLLWTLLALTGRELLVGVVDVGLLSRGNLWYAPDESVYIEHAYAIWLHWVDPSAPFAPDPYSASWYVHGMARLYQLLGAENLVVVKLINTSAEVVACLLGYRIMRNLGMPGARWAIVLLLWFPSIAFWSALTLKDAYVIFFLVLSLWAASEFVRGRNYLWLVVALLAVEPLETVRLYMLVTGALALLALPFALTLWRDRLRAGAAVLVGVYTMFGLIQPFSDLGTNILWIPILLRGEVAQGARSSFVDPRPVINGDAGDRFQVVIAGSTCPPGQTARVVVVEAGSAIVVEGHPPAASPTGSVVVIRQCDIVQIATRRPAPGGSAGPSTPTPRPTVAAAEPSPRVINIEPEARNLVGLVSDFDPDEASFSSSLMTNIRHLPTGITYTLLAPFPWTARTLEQYATIPEMLIWYLCIVAAILGFAVLCRRRDFRYAHGVAAIIGLTLVLSLISANVGTLIRSRAMLIPYVLLLTGVGIDVLLTRYPRIVARFPLLRWPRSS